MPLDHGGEQHETAWLPPEFKREVLDLIHAGRSVAWRSASMASWGWSFRPGWPHQSLRRLPAEDVALTGS